MRYHGACVTDSLVYVVTELMRGGGAFTQTHTRTHICFPLNLFLLHFFLLQLLL